MAIANWQRLSRAIAHQSLREDQTMRSFWTICAHSLNIPYTCVMNKSFVEYTNYIMMNAFHCLQVADVGPLSVGLNRNAQCKFSVAVPILKILLGTVNHWLCFFEKLSFDGWMAWPLQCFSFPAGVISTDSVSEPSKVGLRLWRNLGNPQRAPISGA